MLGFGSRVQWCCWNEGRRRWPLLVGLNRLSGWIVGFRLGDFFWFIFSGSGTSGSKVFYGSMPFFRVFFIWFNMWSGFMFRFYISSVGASLLSFFFGLTYDRFYITSMSFILIHLFLWLCRQILGFGSYWLVWEFFYWTIKDFLVNLQKSF